MSKPHILVIEDDQNISNLIKYNFEKEGYICTTASTGEDGLDVLRHESIDLIILDVMLPGIDGLEVCRRIRSANKNSNLPIIMLTARGEEIDRILGLELGSDDYMVKPFSPRELLIRAKKILNRAKGSNDDTKEILVLGDLKIDIPRHKVFIKEKEIVLTSMEFKLLVILYKRKGRVQSRERLLNDVWDMGADVTTRTIDTHVKCLRKKMETAGNLIETVRGVGYRLTDES